MQPQSPRPQSSTPPVRARGYTASTPLVPQRPPAVPAFQQPSAQPQPVSGQGRRSLGRRLAISPRAASIALVVFALVIAGGIGVWRATASRQSLPSAVAQQLSFGVYFPTTPTNLATIDKRTISYQAMTGLLSYTARLQDGTTINVNQQATPTSFVDIPQAYDKLLSSLQPYTSFDSVNGKVSLTHPKELKGDQSAVMNARGTLLFARPSKPLTDTQWRQLFNGLFAQQIPAAK